MLITRIDNVKRYLTRFKGTEKMDPKICEEIALLKFEAVALGNENLAKELWCLESTFYIANAYLGAFKSLKDKKHFDSWRLLEIAEINLCSLRKHLDFEDNKYQLKFYEKMVYQFQKLFPYEYFMSREAVIKKSKCSICGETIRIRNFCGHKRGEIYGGEICLHMVEDIDLKALAIVKNPFDKYTVLFPQDLEYNYINLDNLLENLSGPFNNWYLTIEKEKRVEFSKTKRNDLCPCNSGKKYKKCCRDTSNELFDHYKIKIDTKETRKDIPRYRSSTWK